MGDEIVVQEPVAIGTSSPTPTGMYYLHDAVKTPNPGGAYGPFVFGLAAHSNVYEKFGGGDGMVGIHGTNQPGLIGRSVSHGCIRMYNAWITKLVNLMPVGTPLVKRSAPSLRDVGASRATARLRSSRRSRRRSAR